MSETFSTELSYNYRVFCATAAAVAAGTDAYCVCVCIKQAAVKKELLLVQIILIFDHSLTVRV